MKEKDEKMKELKERFNHKIDRPLYSSVCTVSMRDSF